jgi:hypothetical protein
LKLLKDSIEFLIILSQETHKMASITTESLYKLFARKIVTDGDRFTFLTRVREDPTFNSVVCGSGAFDDVVDILTCKPEHQLIKPTEHHSLMFSYMLSHIASTHDRESNAAGFDKPIPTQIKAAIQTAASRNNAWIVANILNAFCVTEKTFDQWFRIEDMHAHAELGHLQIVKLIFVGLGSGANLGEILHTFEQNGHVQEHAQFVNWIYPIKVISCRDYLDSLCRRY